METQKFSEFTYHVDPVMRIAGLAVDSKTGGYVNVITDNRYLPTEAEFNEKMDTADYLPYMATIGAELMRLNADNQSAFNDRETILQYIFSDIYPRLIAVEQVAGIDHGHNLAPSGTPRPHIAWTFDAYMEDTQTIAFSTKELANDSLAPDKFDIEKSGLPYNANAQNNGTGVGYCQLPWGHTQTFIRVYKADIAGYRDNLPADIRVILFNNWWIQNVPWNG